MKRHLWLWLTILLAAAALVASAMLLIDYIRPSPVFCDGDGPCGKVKMTPFARPLGIPMPAVGLMGMLAIGLAALVPGKGARRAQAVFAVVGALVAALLFAVQGALGVLCPYCAVVDTAAIALAGLSLARWKKEWDPPPGRRIPGVAVLTLVGAVAIPLVVGFRKRVIPTTLPDVIAAEMRVTGPDKVTVVDFVDFECPFCRMNHLELSPVVEKHKSKVRLVRKHVPLRMHPHALDAAKAACCGESLGKGDQMADALFMTPVNDLTPEGCEKVAREQGLDVDRFRACVNDPATAARIEKDKEAHRAAKNHGLPTVWLDGMKLEGAQERAALESAFDAAIRAL